MLNMHGCLIIILIILNNQIKEVIFVDLFNMNNKLIGFGLVNVDTFIIRVGFKLTNVDMTRTRPIDTNCHP